ALGAALWGLALELRPLAWAATGIAVVTVALALVHYTEKPSGVNVLGGSAPTSVWNLSRAQVLGHFLRPRQREVVAALGSRAKKGDTVALAIRREDVSYPFFGEPLDRRVEFASVAADYDWAVAAPGIIVDQEFLARPVLASHGWRLYHR